MLPQETIEGRGVRLRPYREADAEDLANGCDDPLTQRFLPLLPRPYTRADALSWINDGAPAAWAVGGAAYAIADPDTDRLVGGIGLGRVVVPRGQGEIGYWVAPWARGRGVASAAATALAGWAFERGLARLELPTEMENPASQRVAVTAGFRREGVRRGTGLGRDGTRHDHVVWARLADDPPGPVPRLLPDLPGGVLTDAVVTLRPLGPDDEDFLHTLHTQPDVVATSVPPLPPDRVETALRCARAQARWLAGERADLVIVEAATGTATGGIGLYYQMPPIGQALIGYSMLPAWRGRGFTTRAALLLARWAFEQAGIQRLVAGTKPENAGSQRVLERAGFRREGYERRLLPGLDGTRIDNVLFALLPEDLPRTHLPPGTGQPLPAQPGYATRLTTP
jgi:RimJ/RimL family protein N-acetyltransferase